MSSSDSHEKWYVTLINWAVAIFLILFAFGFTAAYGFRIGTVLAIMTAFLSLPLQKVRELWGSAYGRTRWIILLLCFLFLFTLAGSYSRG